MSQATVRTLPQAKEWFSQNSSGIVLCVKDGGSQQTCGTYAEAEQFYGKPEEAAATDGGEAVGDGGETAAVGGGGSGDATDSE